MEQSINDKQTDIGEESKLIVKDKPIMNHTLASIKTFEDVEKLAEYVANSPVYSEAFKTDAGDGKGKVVSRGSIVACIVLGMEMGFTPMQSIILGRRLNQKSLVQVNMGRELGLSPMQSMQDIHVFDAGGRECVYTGIHIVNAKLTQAGVIREVIEDGTKTVAIYSHAKTGVSIDSFNPNQYVVVNDGNISSERLKEELKNGKIPVLATYTKRAKVKLTRGKESVVMSYSLQDAIDAELYGGKKTNGEEVKGKANWNNHPATHLRKMCIMNGARLIASDVLKGIYIPEELSFVKDDGNVEYDDAEVLE